MVIVGIANVRVRVRVTIVKPGVRNRVSYSPSVPSVRVT